MATAATFDFQDLTLEEIEFFEEYTGVTLEAVQPGRMPAKVLTAVAYLAKKRTDPDFTIDQAKKLKITEATDALGSIVAPPSTPAS